MATDAYSKLYDVAFRKKLKEAPKEALENLNYDFSNIAKDAKFVLVTSPKDVIHLVIPHGFDAESVNDLRNVQSAGSASTAGTIGSFGTLASTVSTASSVLSAGSAS